MPYLRQSTAQTVRFGPFLDSTDGVTAETGLTIAQADMQLSKDGGAFAQKSAAGNATHDTDGWYSTSLSTTDTNTVGELILQITESGALPVWLRWYVLEESVYDGLFASGSAYTAQTGDSFARLGAPAGASVSADIAVIEGQTDDIGIAGAGLTALPISPANVTQISGDATAADNAELFFDNTGFTASNSTIGTCTTNTDMRGTDSAALASVLGALTDAAAAGDPTATDTVVAYLKQIINTLEGTVGIPTFPAAADPANAVSIAEAIRAIRDDVTGLAGAAMRGTDSALLASSAPTNFSDLSITATTGRVDVASVAGTAQTANDNGADINAILVDTNSLNDTKIPDTISLANINAEVDTALTDYDGVIPADLGMPQTNTAFSNIAFLMVDSTDNFTPETGLTVSGTRSIDGGAFSAVSGTIAEVANGIYQFDALAADMNGDVITFRFTATGASDTFLTIKTRP